MDPPDPESKRGKPRERYYVTCTLCGVPVRLDKLRGHFSKMHPASIDCYAEHRARILSNHHVIQPTDYTNCPHCGKRVLTTTLRDHIQATCPERGKGSTKQSPWQGPSYDGHWPPW